MDCMLSCFFPWKPCLIFLLSTCVILPQCLEILCQTDLTDSQRGEITKLQEKYSWNASGSKGLRVSVSASTTFSSSLSFYCFTDLCFWPCIIQGRVVQGFLCRICVLRSKRSGWVSLIWLIQCVLLTVPMHSSILQLVQGLSLLKVGFRRWQQKMTSYWLLFSGTAELYLSACSASARIKWRFSRAAARAPGPQLPAWSQCFYSLPLQADLHRISLTQLMFNFKSCIFVCVYFHFGEQTRCSAKFTLS